MIKKCPVCSREFKPLTIRHRFCSLKCKLEHGRRQKALARDFDSEWAAWNRDFQAQKQEAPK